MEQTTFPVQSKKTTITDMIEFNTLQNTEACNLELPLTYSGSWRYFYLPSRIRQGRQGCSVVSMAAIKNMLFGKKNKKQRPLAGHAQSSEEQLCLKEGEVNGKKSTKLVTIFMEFVHYGRSREILRIFSSKVTVRTLQPLSYSKQVIKNPELFAPRKRILSISIETNICPS